MRRTEAQLETIHMICWSIGAAFWTSRGEQDFQEQS
jgi:hypothetical protein